MFPRRAVLATLPLVALLAVAGCGGSSGHKTVAGTPAPVPSFSKIPVTGANCGSMQTGSGVSADLRVTAGKVACPEAMSVYKAYFSQLVKGDAPGNGGGGTVKVQGWTCDSYPDTEIQQTGKGAYCSKSGATVTAFVKPTGS